MRLSDRSERKICSGYWKLIVRCSGLIRNLIAVRERWNSASIYMCDAGQAGCMGGAYDILIDKTSVE